MLRGTYTAEKVTILNFLPSKISQLQISHCFSNNKTTFVKLLKSLRWFVRSKHRSQQIIIIKIIKHAFEVQMSPCYINFKDPPQIICFSFTLDTITSSTIYLARRSGLARWLGPRVGLSTTTSCGTTTAAFTSTTKTISY